MKWTVAAFPVAGAAALVIVGCQGGSAPAFTQLAEARHLTDDLRIELSKTSDASDRAVMADTDEESVTFAHDAEKSSGAVALDAAALAAHLQNLGYREEARLLEEFSNRFARYRQVDREVLDLAVQNTNLKAQRLSFGPIREAADRFHDMLAAAAVATAAKDGCRAEGLVARAVMAVREIQILQVPHIAEPSEESMSNMEKEMTARAATARDALALLGRGASPAVIQKLDAAKAALGRFDDLSAELVALSRKNSNVRSLALSLRRTPALVAACDASLAQLQDALARRGFSGTR